MHSVNLFNPVSEKKAWLFTEIRNILLDSKEIKISTLVKQLNDEALRHGTIVSEKLVKHFLIKLRKLGMLDFDNADIYNVTIPDTLTYKQFRNMQDD